MSNQRAGYVGAIRTAVAMRRDLPACVFQGRVTKWGEMLERAARIAGGIRTLGVVPGDRVAILSANSDDYLALYLAIPWAGAVITPLNNRWSAAENAFALDDCEPRLLFVSDELAEPNAAMLARYADRLTIVSLGTDRPGWEAFDTLLAHAPIEDAGRGDDDLLAIFYTGGTTGRAKGVMLSHQGFLGNCAAVRDLAICPDHTRMLIVAPLFHLAAAAALTLTMLAGGTAVIAPVFDPAAALDLIAGERVSEAMLVPTMIQMILDAPGLDAGKLATLERVLYGASPMPEAVIDRIIAIAPHIDFFQAYGMTEASCAVTVLRPEYHHGLHRAAGRHRGAGQAVATAEIRIADPDGLPLAIGEIGEILVRGGGVMLGYWNQPQLTAATVCDGWLHTGDGGRIDEHGMLYVVDRIKDMIVSGGENVYSAEVESAIARHPDVAQGAVIGVPDERWGERVHALIVPRPGSSLSPESVVDHCRALIAGYKCPRSVEFRTALPLSPAGKVLKAELRKPYWEGRNRNVA